MRRKRDRKLTKQLARKIEEGRSPLYVYMLDNYDDLSAKLDRPSPMWTAVAAAIADRGVIGANGAPPTPGSVRSMWRWVKREKAEMAEQPSSTSQHRKQPNRSPRTALPMPGIRAAASPAPPVRAPPPPPPLAQASSKSPSDGTAPTVSPEVQAKLDKLRGQLAKADRYLGLPITGKNS